MFYLWRLSGKESTCKAGNTGLISGLGRSQGEGMGNPLQHSCLGNPMNRGARRATVQGVAKQSDTTERTYTQHTVRNKYLVFIPGFWHRAPATWNFLSNKNDNILFKAQIRIQYVSTFKNICSLSLSFCVCVCVCVHSVLSKSL